MHKDNTTPIIKNKTKIQNKNTKIQKTIKYYLLLIFNRNQEMPFAATQHTFNMRLSPAFVVGFSNSHPSFRVHPQEAVPRVGSALLPFIVGVDAVQLKEQKGVHRELERIECERCGRRC